MAGMEIAVETKDCYGNVLSAGDTVMVIKDLKVKGTAVTLKQGTKIKNIRLTDRQEEVECNTDKVKGLVLRTEFLKKV
jgi:protein PhnA